MSSRFMSEEPGGLQVPVYESAAQDNQGKRKCRHVQKALDGIGVRRGSSIGNVEKRASSKPEFVDERQGPSKGNGEHRTSSKRSSTFLPHTTLYPPREPPPEKMAPRRSTLVNIKKSPDEYDSADCGNASSSSSPSRSTSKSGTVGCAAESKDNESFGFGVATHNFEDPEIILGFLGGRRVSILQRRLQDAQAHAGTEPRRPRSPGVSATRIFGEVVDVIEGREVHKRVMDSWIDVFRNMQQDGEVHKTQLVDAIQRCGHGHLSQEDCSDLLPQLSFATLSQEDFVRCMCKVEIRSEAVNRDKFATLNNGAPLEQSRMMSFFGLLSVKARLVVVSEVCMDVAQGDASATFSFEDCMRAAELCRSREGFLKMELDRFKLAFSAFGRGRSGDIGVVELKSILGWLGVPLPRELLEVVHSVAGPQADELNERQFIRILRLLFDAEFVEVTKLLHVHGAMNDKVSGEALEQVLSDFKYHPPGGAILEALSDLKIGGPDVETYLDEIRSSGKTCRFLSLQGVRLLLNAEEVFDLIMAIRSREGFTREDWNELQRVFESFIEGDSRELSPKGTSRALRMMGHFLSLNRLRLYLFELEGAAGGGSVHLGFRSFVKLVRKCQDHYEARAREVFLGITGQSPFSQIAAAEQTQAFQAMGCVDGEGRPMTTSTVIEKMSLKQFLLEVQKMKADMVPRMREQAGFTDVAARKFQEAYQFATYQSDDFIGSKGLAQILETFFPGYSRSASFRPRMTKMIEAINTERGGLIDFDDVLECMCVVHELIDDARLLAEVKAIEELKYAPQDVQSLRVLFLEMGAVGGNEDVLALSKVRDMFRRVTKQRSHFVFENLLTEALHEIEVKGKGTGFVDKVEEDGDGARR